MEQAVKLELCELGPDAHGLESISPFCLKVHRALKFHGLSYERRHAMRPSEHKDLSPTGQVPVLIIDGKPVGDSTAIIEALEDLSAKSLVPVDRQQRTEAWFWEDYADQVLGFYVFSARWFDDRNFNAVVDEQFRSMPAFLKPWLPKLIRRRILKNMSSMEFIRRGQADYWQSFQEHLDKLDDQAPEAGFWVGANLSVADIALFSILHSLRTKLSQWQMQEIAKRPALSAWLDRVDAATQ